LKSQIISFKGFEIIVTSVEQSLNSDQTISPEFQRVLYCEEESSVEVWFTKRSPYIPAGSVLQNSVKYRSTENTEVTFNIPSLRATLNLNSLVALLAICQKYQTVSSESSVGFAEIEALHPLKDLFARLNKNDADECDKEIDFPHLSILMNQVTIYL